MTMSINTKNHWNFDLKKCLKVFIFVSMLGVLTYLSYGLFAVKEPLVRQIVDYPMVENGLTSPKKIDVPKSDEQKQEHYTSPLDSITSADARDNIQWHADKGYFTEEDLSAYQSYSDDELNSLIKNGDVRAMDLMARKMVEQNMPETATVLYWMAAVHGSSASLRNLAFLAEPDYKLGETTEEHKIVYRQSVIESLALMQTAALRGDIRNAAQGVKSVKQLYESQSKEQLVLSSAEQLRIETRSQEIYEQLQKQRRELGLGEFDNSISKVERLLYEFMY